MNDKKNNTDTLQSGCSYKMMKIDDIIIEEEFSSIFPIQENTLNSITNSILANGYDKGEPVTLWEYKKQKYILIDGHTRLKAAENAGLKEIPVSIMYFNNLKEAKTYTVLRQAHRRNLTQIEILEAAKIYASKERRDGSGRIAEILSREIGVSPSTIVHAKAVADKASKEDLNAIKNGKATINSVYQKIKNKKPKKTSDNYSENDRQKSSLTSNLVNIKVILQLLKEHNEMDAISVILEKYKNLKIQDY
jgi:ParB/RepB/Spo0J family partition protein